MANFQIHELTSGTIDRDSNVIHDTLNGLDYETRKATAGAVADLNNIQIANEYDDTSTYSYGDYTIKNGVLYRNIVAITSPEAWTSAHWTAVMVTGEYKRVRIMTKAQFDLLSNDEKDGFIYVSDYPTKIQDIDNVTLTTSDNNKLLGVSVSGSDISVGAVGVEDVTNTFSVTNKSAGLSTFTVNSAYKYGNIICINLSYKITSGSIGTSEGCTLSSPYIPKYNVNGSGFNVADYSFMTYYYDAGVSIRRMSTMGTDKSFSVNLIYILT